jgi:hypothetical protein
MVVQACNPSTWETEAVDHEFKVSLDYTVQSCLRKKKQLSKLRREGNFLNPINNIYEKLTHKYNGGRLKTP